MSNCEEFKLRNKWILRAKEADIEAISRKYNISPVVARCMVNRGVLTEEEQDSFMNGTLDSLSSPWLFADMDKAIDIIIAAKERYSDDLKVAVGSDYDCDGIFSAFILKKGFEKAGIENKIFTPDRISEGYGLNTRIVDDAVEFGAQVLITCDNGIAANEAVEYAKEKGLMVIVTDHHEVQECLPVADAVVDPKREDCDYPFKGLCGAGVTYQLVGALYEKLGIGRQVQQELIEYAAIATVADVMELIGENRILVKQGLKKLPHTENVGIRALIRAQGIDNREIKAYHIGFVIGPCFNAAGRIDTVQKSFELLAEEDEDKANQMAGELKDINDKRKSMTEEATDLAYEIMESQGLVEDDVHVVYIPGCHESLVGIVAGRIKERFHHPVIVFTDAEDDLVKGSGRSIEQYHMFEKLMECKDIMVRFGGHKMAAGMTIKKADLGELKARLNANSGLVEDDFVPVLEIDYPLPVQYITEKMIEELDILEPFGTGNPKPVFAEQHFKVLRAAVRGASRNVLSLRVANASGKSVDAVYFGNITEFEDFIKEEWGESELHALYEGKINNVDLGLAFYPDINEFRGVKNIQLIIQDFCRVRR